MGRVDEGKVSEYQCATELLKRGITPNWPSVETEPFDIIASVSQRFARLQVKSSKQAKPSLRLSTETNGKHKPYTKEEVDFIVIWARHADVWYVIPIEEITSKNIGLDPAKAGCKWAQYIDAWHLIKGMKE